MRREKNIIKLMVVDDHPIFRSGIRNEMGKSENIIVISEAAGCKEALLLLQKVEPDIILLDLSMPEIDGFSAAKKIKKLHPAIKIIGFSVHENTNYAAELLRSGAQGYVLKDTSPEELIKAIELVYNGLLYLSPKINRNLESRVNAIRNSRKQLFIKLTPRETDVVRYVANGYSNKMIAKKLSISVRTVEVHREHIYRKLEIRTAAEITKYAIKQNLTELPI
ncbi:MAG: response regulator transcription factor [Ignavibacteria bacterium]|nr:response regulator transcription factor [Ignavibacteria bacterium]